MSTPPEQPPEGTFAVWFNSNREPEYVYYHDTACTDGVAVWWPANGELFEDDDAREPLPWTDLCHRARFADGPHLLVAAPGGGR